MWSGRDGEAEEAAEGGLGRAAAIEAEDELVEPRVRLAGPRPGSGLEVLLAQPVVDPQRPLQLPTSSTSRRGGYSYGFDLRLDPIRLDHVRALERLSPEECDSEDSQQ